MVCEYGWEGLFQGMLTMSYVKLWCTETVQVMTKTGAIWLRSIKISFLRHLCKFLYDDVGRGWFVGWIRSRQDFCFSFYSDAYFINIWWRLVMSHFLVKKRINLSQWLKFFWVGATTRSTSFCCILCNTVWVVLMFMVLFFYSVDDDLWR